MSCIQSTSATSAFRVASRVEIILGEFIICHCMHSTTIVLGCIKAVISILATIYGSLRPSFAINKYNNSLNGNLALKWTIELI